MRKLLLGLFLLCGVGFSDTFFKVDQDNYIKTIKNQIKTNGDIKKVFLKPNQGKFSEIRIIFRNSFSFTFVTDFNKFNPILTLDKLGLLNNIKEQK